jgi:hypothetical protein
MTPNINKRLASVKAYNERGSNMGRPNYKPYMHCKCYLQQVNIGQGYDPGGAYWGLPNDLWCAFTIGDDCVEVFVRANNREKAKEKLLQEYAQIGFIR